MVQVAISWGGELECPEADVVKRLVINAESLVRVLDQLMNGQSGVVGLDVARSGYIVCVHEVHTSTTVSETLGLGTTEYVHIILSG